MTERIEQRICIKFCQKLGHSASETIAMIRKVYGDESMGDTQIKEWFRRFKNGRISVESDERSGRPLTARNTENVERVRAAINENRRLTVRELEEDLGIQKSSVCNILHEDLKMSRVSAKFVPRLLAEDQKKCRLEIAQDNLDLIKSDPGLFKKVITGDESWVYGYDPETKAQSSQWKTREEQRPKKARQSRSNVKTMITVFFDQDGIVHHEYAPRGQTVNKEYYLEVLRRLRDAVRRKRPELWTSRDWLLHHDNAPAHSSNLIQHFLVKHDIKQLRQPPYSPDIAPSDFWLFPKLKIPLKGKRFDDVEQIKQNATKDLLAIPKDEFKKCFQKWEERWNKVVAYGGEYFEGDQITVAAE